MSDGRYVMGTVLEITLVAPGEPAGRAALAELFGLAQRLDALFTSYDPESGVSRLNRAAGRGPQRVEPDLHALLGQAQRYTELTRGSFDVTVGPLIELWRGAATTGELPSRAALAQARGRVGPQGVRVRGDGRAELMRAGVRVDLGGIAKGYALDRMRPLLERHGARGALLNFGQSSTWALGTPEEGEGWRLAARGPEGGVLGVLTLRDQALSVSGSLGQWLEIGGRRFGHVIDPRSGQPLTRRRQALVVAPEAALAEALSKALLVLGEGEALDLVAGQPGCEALLVDAGGGRWESAGWRGATRFEGLPDGFR